MDPVDVEPPYELILDGLERGKVIPFLGAGASLPSLMGDGPSPCGSAGATG